jgi:hypothetical protein
MLPKILFENQRLVDGARIIWVMLTKTGAFGKDSILNQTGSRKRKQNYHTSLVKGS